MDILLNNIPFIAIVLAAVGFVSLLYAVYINLRTMKEEIIEVLIVSGDDRGEKLEALSSEIKALRAENHNLRSEINAVAAKVSAANSQALGTAISRINFEPVITNLQAIFRVQEELSGHLKALRGELHNTNSQLEGLGRSDNTEIIDMLRKIEDTLHILPEISAKLDEISGKDSTDLTADQQEALANLKTSINKLTEFAASITGAITMNQGSIESTLNKTDDAVRRIIARATERIEQDYRDNLEKMFQTINKNLRTLLAKYIQRTDGGKNDVQS